ncbi:family 1 encapsulin nanocompartment shell protein [Cetobacterium sp. SF1]|uniref:family 1 encapsulin nanocompartment shell protein n=1 Tax=Cetobacterium sp. SF1 TaxID=3417654 RepID=UPI003CF6F070
MDFLKRELAPLSRDAWEAIDDRAKEVLTSTLSVRKFAKMNGPMGFGFKAVNVGRLAVKESNGVNYGINQMLPLVEVRNNFTLNRWEMDNISRGAKDIDLSSLEQAILKTVEFSENAVYSGLDEACILGLTKSTDHNHMTLGTTAGEILGNLSKAVLSLRDSFAGEGSYDLVVSEEIYTRLLSITEVSDFMGVIKSILHKGKVIVSKFLKGAILLPHNNENIELTVGQDYSIGYQEHNEKEVKLYVTLTFTFRVTDPTLVVVFDK